ncbi:MAG: hypothetical protein J5724_06625 [Ruminococcus sp.]|nr:hypothetical protein [Ruminococcus sp.]
MRSRRMCIILLSLFCLIMTGCGLQDYPTYTYELTNGIGEKYLVNYCEQTNYPENLTRVKVFKDKDKISDYNGGAYTNSDSYIPSQIMSLGSFENVDYYYFRTQTGEYIVADGVVDIKLNFNMLFISKPVPEMTDAEKRSYAKLAEIIRNAVTEEYIEKQFSACGYSSDIFMAFYSYE